MANPSDVLRELAAMLRAQRTPISERVRDPDPAARPALGELAASGPRASKAPGEYALIVEAIREGYELHYGDPRLVAGADTELALLAGDHLYALGLERLAALGDLEAVRELADLISLSAQVHADGGRDTDPRGSELAAALWLGAVTAIAAGGGDAHERAKLALRNSDPEATDALARAAAKTASVTGITDALRAACQAIDFALDGRI